MSLSLLNKAPAAAARAANARLVAPRVSALPARVSRRSVTVRADSQSERKTITRDAEPEQ